MRERSARSEFLQGTIDNSYIQLAPNVGGMVEMDWRINRAQCLSSQYRSAEIHSDPMADARAHWAGRPVEPYSRYLPRRDRVML